MCLDFDLKEKRFEEDIESYLCSQGGYVKGNPKDFDRKLALDTAAFVTFIKNSQPKEWASYAKTNDLKTFMMLFTKDFPQMAAKRYEQNDDFFVKMFSEPEMMQQIMETIGMVIYEKLRRNA